MHTKLSYTNGECSLREYYGQWATPAVIKVVVDAIGFDRILDSHRPPNIVSVDEWASMAAEIQAALTDTDRQGIREAGDSTNLMSFIVGLGIAAARKWNAETGIAYQPKKEKE